MGKSSNRKKARSLETPAVVAEQALARPPVVMRASWALSLLLFLGSLVLGFYGFTRQYQSVPWVDKNSFLMQGDYYVKNNQPDEAMREYEKAKAIDRGNFFAFYKHGYAAFLAKQPEVALQSFQDAAARKSDCAECYYRIALILVSEGRISEGLGEFQRALSIEPDRAEVLAAYGTALARSGRASEAAAALSRALEIEPGLQTARRNLDLVNQVLGSRR